jgi:membrane-associated phospholipid phosphatase
LNGAHPQEFPARRAAGAWAIVMVVVLALLAAAVNARFLRVNDEILFGVAQAPASSALDVVMLLVSILGSVEVTTVVMLALVFVPMWRRRRFSAPGLLPLLVFILIIGVEVVGKTVIKQPLPPEALNRGGHLGIGLVTTYSFPSGHMLRATLVYGLGAVRWLRRGADPSWLWLWVAVIWLIGFSRVYLGQHWPTDVAGGILLGGAALAAVLALAPGASLAEE